MGVSPGAAARSAAKDMNPTLVKRGEATVDSSPPKQSPECPT